MTGGAHPARVAAVAAVERSGRRAASLANSARTAARDAAHATTAHDQEHREEPGAEHERVDIEPRARLGVARDAERHQRRRQPRTQHAEQRAPGCDRNERERERRDARTARDAEPAQRGDSARGPVHESAQRDRDDHDAGQRDHGRERDERRAQHVDRLLHRPFGLRRRLHLELARLHRVVRASLAPAARTRAPPPRR